MRRLLILVFVLSLFAPGYFLFTSTPIHAPLAVAHPNPATLRVAHPVQLMHPGTSQAHLGSAARNDSPPRPGRAHRVVQRLPLLRLPRVLPNITVDVPILMYHHVSAITPTTDLNFGLTVTDA